MNSSKLSVEYLPIDSIRPYERNAKKHPPEQIAQIVRSIQDTGMNDPIGIWSEKNIIVEGHGRWMACKQLGMVTVPVIRLDHLTDEQRREYAIIHNQTTMNSGWDLPVLDMELGELPDFDAAFYGFDDKSMPPIPENLDADDGYDNQSSLVVKFTFLNFDAYSMYENELKNIAERMGAQFALVRS